MPGKSTEWIASLCARKFQSEQYRMPWSGLRGQRTSLIPHQLNIAHDVGRRHAPRVLLADEVGTGKTIEAGMILHQQLLSGAAERVLIVVPETLQHQWLVEMLRRFNLRFSLFDDERYAEAQHDADNPFETEQLVICSTDFVRRSKQRTEHLCDAEWDLMVVDEAHHLVWSEDAPSREYMAIEQLAERVPCVLLLTATRSSWVLRATSPVCACSIRTVSTILSSLLKSRKLSSGGGRRRAAAGR